MKTLLTTWFAALMSVASFAQAPGGVSTGLVSWFKADAGIAPTANGGTITAWADQSATAMHATQTGATTSRPLYYTNVINGHPALRTSVSRFLNVDWSIINDTNYTIYAVTRRLGAGNFNHILGIQGTSASQSHLSLGYTSNTFVRHTQYGNFLTIITEGYNATTEIPTVMACQFNEAIGKAAWRIRDGVKTSSSGTNKTHYPYPAGIRGRIGRGGDGYGFNGYIAEIFVYDRVLTDEEKKSINTYLSVKYGLSVPSSEHLYALDAPYHNDVFGIARDNSFALAQTASESVSLDDVLRISSPSALSDGDYLICGNDNGAVTFGAYAGENCSISRVLARDWMFKHIGDCGTVNLRFDLTGVTGFNANDLRLLVDMDGDGYDDETPLTGVYAAPYFTVSLVTLPHDAKITLCNVNTHYYAVVPNSISDGLVWSTTPGGAAEFALNDENTCPSIDLTVNAGVILQVNGTLTCRNLTVDGTLNLGDDYSDNLIVHGNIQMNGSWSTSAPGSLSFHGDAAQSVSGGVISVYNADITNPAGVTLNNTRFDIRYNLAITDTGVLNTNGKLKLVSDVNGTGEIQSLEEGTINGTVQVYRYRPAVAAGWVNLCSPVAGATIQEWNDDLTTTGFPGSDAPTWPSEANPYVNIKWYNEEVAGTDQDGYVGVTNVTNPLVPGKGYMVYMPIGAATIDYPAYTINSGDYDLDVTYTDNGSGRGWNMVGNPYPATIKWDTTNWVMHNMNNEVHVWNPNSNQYVSYSQATGVLPIIAPGQSFFVRANGPDPVLTVREQCKVKTHATFRSMETSNDYLTIRIQKDDLQDQTILKRMENMTKSFDNNYDAAKLHSPVAEVPYLATLDQEGEDLSINAFNNSGEETIIPIRIEAGVSGTYQLTVTGLNTFAQGGCVTLEDVFTGATYVLTEEKPIGLELTAGDHTLRYQLRIGAPIAAAVTDAGCSVEEGGSAEVNVPANATEAITWYTAQGKFVGATLPENGIASIGGLQAGSYVAKLNHNGACGVTEVAFEVAQLSKLGASAVVMPASCGNTDDGGISISLSGGEAPFAIVWNNGTEGAMIDNATAGKYIATVTDINGCGGRFEFEVPSVSQLLSKFESSHEKVEMVDGQATVEFTNTSRDAEAFTWNFGDGSDEVYDENPAHTYMNAGTYEVMLKATHDNCESVSTKTIAVIDESHAEQFAGDILATLTDQGVKMTFFFDEQKNLQINAYNVLGQQLIEPITGVYDTQTIMFSDRRYAAQALIEITDLNTGEKALIRLGR
ncbi:MAG: PKD domain-containing protein [Flavobacteriales bacterium]